MKAILNFILNLGWLGKIGEFLNGKKTALGAIALLIHNLQIMQVFFPECAICPDIASGLQTFLEYAGVSLVSVGLAGKAVK